MHKIVLFAPALLLGACQVTDDKGNDQVTVSYNQDVVENACAKALNTIDQAAGAIVNDTKEASAAVKNLDVDVSVDTKKNKTEPAPANSN